MKRAKLRRLALISLFAGLLIPGGCGDKGPTKPDKPVPASVTLSESSLSLTFIGHSLRLSATVSDQFDEPYTAPVVVVWSSADPSVATVATDGTVVAAGNGETTVTGTVDGTSPAVSATATVTVQQLASRVTVVSGNTQTGPVDEELSELIVVRSQDLGGTAVAGTSVTFSLAAGGSVSVPDITTDSEGLASTAWTLSTTSGIQSLTAAIAGSSSGSVQFTATALAGSPAAVVKDSGDQQIAPAGLALFEPVTVRVTDEFGNGVAGEDVSFAITGGGGSVDPAQASAGEDGVAEAVWTMGAGLGVNTLTATASDFPPVEFTATAVAAKADLEPGTLETSPAYPTELQSFEVSTTVTNVGYLAADAGVPVQLLVDGAEGDATTLPALAIGAEAIVTFTIGPLSAGTHAFEAVVDPEGALDEWDESNNSSLGSTEIPVTTLLTAGTPVPNLSAADSVEYLFTLEVPVSTPGTVEITLSGGTGDPDLYVHHGDRPAHRDDYECQSGNPNTTERCVINAAEPGTYHILIFAWDEYAGTTLLATTGGPVIPYDIELVFINHGTAQQDAVFEAAAARWMEIIPGDISDFDFSLQPLAAGSCIEGQPLLNDVVDDLRIYVNISEIDGPGDILGSAGPCVIRGLGYFPVVGVMNFDSEDLDALAAADRLLPVILHEMAHVLGLGTLWDYRENDLLQNPSLPSNEGTDTYFSGPRAISAFDAAAGGASYDGNKVPVENVGEDGTADSHWRESVLDRELMTPYLNSGQSHPLSAITIESLADFGYKVDITQADPYFWTYPSPAPAEAEGTRIYLGNDLRKGPIYTVDGKGGIREVVRR